MRNRITIEKIVFGALLTSMAIVTKTLFEIIPLPGPVKRVELFLVFIIVAGILLGPVYGAVSGFVADMVYMMMFPGTIGLFTLAHIIAGLIPGLVFLKLKYHHLTMIITMIITIMLYFTISTIALDRMGYLPATMITIIPRLGRTLLFLPIQYLLVNLLVADHRFNHFSIHQRFHRKGNSTII